VAGRYPEIEPYEHGLLPAGERQLVYWEACGNPRGKPALVLHGGPGSGCTPWFRQLFDPRAYRVVLFDQRNCGRSTPHAGESSVDLSRNTTQHLLGDIELLRRDLGIERWLVLGGSWGSTLALAYAEAHPARVTEMVLFGITTGRHSEWDWAFRGGIARFFPEQWERLLASLPPEERGGDVVEAHARLLHDPDAAVRRRAAEAWCLWESATPGWPPSDELQPRFRDPRYALAFARIVTHYAKHYGWLEDGILLREAGRLADIPAILINGRFDFQAPLENAWALKRSLPSAELVVVDDAGHFAADSRMEAAIVAATDRFAG
jgi:proline iminopeptidase